VIDDLTCRFCTEGTYRDVVDPKGDRHALQNEGFGGLSPMGRRGWRVLECDRCHHIQLFRLSVDESERRGWHG
jgi:hypothetical protein